MRVPKDLQALIEHLAATEDAFGDWQLGRKGSLTRFYPADEVELVALAEKAYLPFAGSYSGGVLTLDLSSDDIEKATVIDFDSEGGITVLGTSFSDFLSLLASDDGNPEEDGRTVAPTLRAWILARGVKSHPSFAARMGELGEMTRQANMRWSAAMREASQRLRPDEVLDYKLVLGESLGGIAIGDAAREQAPFIVKSKLGKVESLTLFSGRHEARTPDGTNFMYMRASDAMAWLTTHGFTPVMDRGAIQAPDAKLRLRISAAGSGRAADPWVYSITLQDG